MIKLSKIEQRAERWLLDFMEDDYYSIDPRILKIKTAARQDFKAGAKVMAELILEEARADKIAASNLSLWVEELIKRAMEK